MTNDMNGGMPSAIFRWILGGVCSGFVVYGYFLIGAIHDVRDEVIRVSTRIEQMVPMAQEIRDIDRLELEISKKADSGYIESLANKLELRIDQVDQNLGFKGHK